MTRNKQSDRIQEILDIMENAMRAWETNSRTGQLNFEINFKDGTVPQKQLKQHTNRTIS